MRKKNNKMNPKELAFWTFVAKFIGWNNTWTVATKVYRALIWLKYEPQILLVKFYNYIERRKINKIMKKLDSELERIKRL